MSSNLIIFLSLSKILPVFIISSISSSKDLMVYLLTGKSSNNKWYNVPLLMLLTFPSKKSGFLWYFVLCFISLTLKYLGTDPFPSYLKSDIF